GNAELTHRDLPRPTAGFDAGMRVVEREAQIWQCAVIGRRRRDHVGILLYSTGILRTRIASSAARSTRLRQLVDGLCISQRCRGQRSSDCSSSQHATARNRTFRDGHDTLSQIALVTYLVTWLHKRTRTRRGNDGTSQTPIRAHGQTRADYYLGFFCIQMFLPLAKPIGTGWTHHDFMRRDNKGAMCSAPRGALTQSPRPNNRGAVNRYRELANSPDVCGQ